MSRGQVTATVHDVIPILLDQYSLLFVIPAMTAPEVARLSWQVAEESSYEGYFFKTMSRP